MKNIYYASIIPTAFENEYQFGEMSEAEYGSEWDGNVVGYIFNSLDDPDEYIITENPEMGNIQQDFTESPENICLLSRKDGTPVEVYWTDK